MVRRALPTAEGDVVVREVPGSFFEMISRDRLADGTLDLAFDAANATGIFAMTRAPATPAPAAEGDVPLPGPSASESPSIRSHDASESPSNRPPTGSDDASESTANRLLTSPDEGRP